MKHVSPPQSAACGVSVSLTKWRLCQSKKSIVPDERLHTVYLYVSPKCISILTTLGTYLVMASYPLLPIHPTFTTPMSTSSKMTIHAVVEMKKVASPSPSCSSDPIASFRPMEMMRVAFSWLLSCGARMTVEAPVVAMLVGGEWRTHSS